MEEKKKKRRRRNENVGYKLYVTFGTERKMKKNKKMNLVRESEAQRLMRQVLKVPTPWEW